MNDRLTQAMKPLDYNEPEIVALVRDRTWEKLSKTKRIGGIYAYVKNEIAFRYNTSDELTAGEVLANGMGQCNTKATLFMALLRRTGMACRLHGFKIRKTLQRSVIPAWSYPFAPQTLTPTRASFWIALTWRTTTND